jgi:hypothetical protein
LLPISVQIDLRLGDGAILSFTIDESLQEMNRITRKHLQVTYEIHKLNVHYGTHSCVLVFLVAISIIEMYMLRSLTSVARWPECVFISEGNPHLTRWFCKDELGSTPNPNSMQNVVA